MKLKFQLAAMLLILAAAMPARAEDYLIDTKGQHAFIQFKISHLGYSWLLGSFKRFSGTFTLDKRHPERSRASVTIDLASIDTNHAERDKHLRSDEFFDVKHFPTASFVSTAYKEKGGDRGVLEGILNLHGYRRAIVIKLRRIGSGPDPWGGYRRGFEGHAMLYLPDYHFSRGKMLGPVARKVELYLSIEGVRTGR